MTEPDKVKMTISVGGEHIALSVDFNKQNAVRETEKIVSDRFDNWRTKYPKRSDKEILAMVAYQYASYYQELLKRFDDALSKAANIDRMLNDILEPRNEAETDDSLL